MTVQEAIVGDDFVDMTVSVEGIVTLLRHFYYA